MRQSRWSTVKMASVGTVQAWWTAVTTASGGVSSFSWGTSRSSSEVSNMGTTARNYSTSTKLKIESATPPLVLGAKHSTTKKPGTRLDGLKSQLLRSAGLEAPPGAIAAGHEKQRMWVLLGLTCNFFTVPGCIVVQYNTVPYRTCCCASTAAPEKLVLL